MGIGTSSGSMLKWSGDLSDIVVGGDGAQGKEKVGDEKKRDFVDEKSMLDWVLATHQRLLQVGMVFRHKYFESLKSSLLDKPRSGGPFVPGDQVMFRGPHSFVGVIVKENTDANFNDKQPYYHVKDEINNNTYDYTRGGDLRAIPPDQQIPISLRNQLKTATADMVTAMESLEMWLTLQLLELKPGSYVWVPGTHEHTPGALSRCRVKIFNAIPPLGGSVVLENGRTISWKCGYHWFLCPELYPEKARSWRVTVGLLPSPNGDAREQALLNAFNYESKFPFTFDHSPDSTSIPLPPIASSSDAKSSPTTVDSTNPYGLMPRETNTPSLDQVVAHLQSAQPHIVSSADTANTKLTNTKSAAGK